MNLTVRYLVARSNGTFERVSWTFMRTLQDEDSVLHLPEFAGMRLRYVEAILAMSDVQSPEIARLTYGTIAINRAGHVDFPVNARARRAQLARAWQAPAEATARANVVFAQDAFTLAGATWQPTVAQQRHLEAIFTNELRAKRFRSARRVHEVTGAAESLQAHDA